MPHCDASVMPKRRAVWSSWNHAGPAGGPRDRIDLTYRMNALQPIPMDDPLFVTLNAGRAIPDAMVHDVTTFHHPVFDGAVLRAQDDIAKANGARATWSCGAWMRNGFHEDGFASALAVADGIRARATARLAA